MGQHQAKEQSSDLPFFCVITTLYNSNATIQKTFDSMLAQTYPNIIHYIYDDGSPQNPRCPGSALP
jgi:glycosyltransferase involved in cell wall biosynthesis